MKLKSFEIHFNIHTSILESMELCEKMILNQRPKLSNVKLMNFSGNIGCGKTTVLSSVETYYAKYPNSSFDTKFFYEPVDEWKLHLNEYYEKQTQNSLIRLQLKIFEYFAHQLVTICNVLYQHPSKKAAMIVFMERSAWDCTRIFIDANENLLDPLVYDDLKNVCDKLWHLMVKLVGESNIYFCYLECKNVHKLNQRIIGRSKNSIQPNATIPLSYLVNLNEKHQKIFNLIGSYQTRNLLKLDTENLNPVQNTQFINQLLCQTFFS